MKSTIFHQVYFLFPKILPYQETKFSSNYCL
uniref:Uncharacterized protein n=1 Tax=Lepeophtheirus salmonis TaxID=72036 RepID=A0A0K2U287_LEPSM